MIGHGSSPWRKKLGGGLPYELCPSTRGNYY
jgi:hypothetical protein